MKKLLRKNTRKRLIDIFKIIEVKHKYKGKSYYFYTDIPDLERGDIVIVENREGYALVNVIGYVETVGTEPTRLVIRKVGLRKLKKAMSKTQSRFIEWQREQMNKEIESVTEYINEISVSIEEVVNELPKISSEEYTIDGVEWLAVLRFSKKEQLIFDNYILNGLYTTLVNNLIRWENSDVDQLLDDMLLIKQRNGEFASVQVEVIKAVLKERVANHDIS